MCPRSESQFEAIRERRRKAILDTALRLFAQKGFAETTTEDIAGGVGISKGLIYNYFSSKQEIVERLITESFRDALPTLMGNGTTPDPGQQLEELVHQWIALIRSSPDLLRLVLQLHTSSAFRKLVQRRAGDILETFHAGIILIFRRMGSREPELDARLLGSLFDGISLNYAARPGVFPLDQMEGRLIALYRSRKALNQ